MNYDEEGNRIYYEDEVKQICDNAYSLGFNEGAKFIIERIKHNLLQRGYINEKTDKGENTEAAEK